MREINILVVDDNAPFRDVLTRFIGTYPDMNVVGVAGCGDDAVAMADGLRPDVVLMDLWMPQADGLDATRRLKRADPSVTVITMTAHRSGESERLSREAGADAFVRKEEAGERLVEIIRSRVAPSAGDASASMPS